MRALPKGVLDSAVMSVRWWAVNQIQVYRVAQKSKPLPNYQKNVLNRIKVCQ